MGSERLGGHDRLFIALCRPPDMGSRRHRTTSIEHFEGVWEWRQNLGPLTSSTEVQSLIVSCRREHGKSIFIILPRALGFVVACLDRIFIKLPEEHHLCFEPPPTRQVYQSTETCCNIHKKKISEAQSQLPCDLPSFLDSRGATTTRDLCIRRYMHVADS